MENDTIFFENLYETHKTEISKFIYAAAGKEGGYADDIFQSVWLNAFKYLGSLRERDKARAWLYAIAKTEIKRYFSRRVVHISLSRNSEDEDAYVEDPVDEASAAFPEALADSDVLARLLNKLEPEQQRIVILYYYYDVSLKDIAAMRQDNYNTTKSIFRRAMEKLRKEAEETGHGSL
jgi:RNA polymerase sigma-70 factor (ECF subfamily)